MSRLARIAWLALPVVLLARGAEGQSSARPRIGYAAPPTPATPPVQAPQPAAPPVYYILRDAYPAGMPYLVLSDGSVLVSFGGGYERVLRQCAPPPPPPANPWAQDALGRIPDPPGIAALKAGTRGQMSGAAPAAAAPACFRVDAQGRVFTVAP